MDAHAREAAAAEAAIAQFYGKRWTPRLGDIVRCERPFRGDFANGVVADVNPAYVTVEIDGEHLAYYEHELEFTGRREGVR